MMKCDGTCSEHIGEVITVHVSSVSGHDWASLTTAKRL